LEGDNHSRQKARFERFELDLRSGELCRQGAEAVQLSEQPFRILAMLLTRPGDLVTREEIRNKLWPNGTIVEFEHSISAAMNRLRQALGDSPENPRYIETLARRGYRWKTPVEWEESSPGATSPAKSGSTETAAAAGGNLIGKKVSHYRVLDILGGGGMGVVYKAEDLRLGRRVALKFLPEELANDPEALKRFEREARAASALSHPNICTIYEIEDHEEQPFIVMELLEGETVRELITQPAWKTTPLPLEKLLDLAVQIIDGLDAAHRQGIIHRDIKPANIFVTTRRQAKILDFGLAKLVRAETGADPLIAPSPEQTEVPGAPPIAASPSLLLSRAGVAMGTAGYMSPEQVRGEKLDARTDLFSFGLVLYEMATGQQAFTGETAAELHEAILTQAPVPTRQLNPVIPPKLESMINRAVKKDREARYQSASQVRADLETLKREIEPKHRAQWKAMAVTVVLVLFLASAAFWLAKRQPQSPAALPQLKLRQLTSNSSENGVTGGAISPDGRYLAYTDTVGMRLKLIETGETRSIPQPDEVKSNWVSWDIAAWFPDGTRFLANAYRQRGDSPNRNSRGASIWMVSLLGGPPHKLRDEAVAYSVSPDGSLVSFGTNPGRRDEHEIWLMQPDGDQARKVFDTDESGEIGGLQWSQDGQRVIYARWDVPHDKLAFVSGDLKGGPITTILPPFDPKEVQDSFWMPDGRLIYDSGEPGPMYHCSLWQIRMDPRLTEFIGKPQRVTTFAGFCAAVLNATLDSKRLALMEWRPNTNIYVADLQAGGARVTTPTRLTMEQSWNEPFGWTADSKTVLFYSNRSDVGVLFKQPLDQDTAEPIVTSKAGESLSLGACLSPEGSWVFYGAGPNNGAPSRLMRVPITGGPPQLVLTANFFGGPRCARSPATLCAIAERSADRTQIVFSAFDPVRGRERKLAEWKTDATADYYWDLSPDGTRIVVLKSREGRIHTLWLNGQAPQDITVKGWRTLSTAVWTAEGNGLFVSSFTERGAVLLHTDLHGNARLLWENKGGLDTYGVPSPDGRHLAMRAWNVDGNVWMMENF